MERIIIGFDPGLANSGYGILSASGSRIRHINHGVCSTSAEIPEEQRLYKLYSDVREIIQVYKPAQAGIESIFFARNVRTAIPVAQARGIIMLACAEAEVRVYSFTPPQIKQRLTGQGDAEKFQVQKMLQFLLGLDEAPASDHAADALAAAYCVTQESVAAVPAQSGAGNSGHGGLSERSAGNSGHGGLSERSAGNIDPEMAKARKRAARNIDPKNIRTEMGGAGTIGAAL